LVSSATLRNIFAGPGPFEATELEITKGETVAFAHCLLHIGGSQEPAGRLTLGLEKARGEWLIAHEHHSYPMEVEQGSQAETQQR